MEDSGRPSLPDLREFETQFRRKYGRDLTEEERWFFRLTEGLLKNPPKDSDEPAKS